MQPARLLLPAPAHPATASAAESRVSSRHHRSSGRVCSQPNVPGASMLTAAGLRPSAQRVPVLKGDVRLQALLLVRLLVQLPLARLRSAMRCAPAGCHAATAAQPHCFSTQYLSTACQAYQSSQRRRKVISRAKGVQRNRRKLSGAREGRQKGRTAHLKMSGWR